jgi:uncharacterized protein with HEPN domain
MNIKDECILRSVLKECDILTSFTTNENLDSFLWDIGTQRKIAMTLALIGESIKGLSENFKDGNSHIAWKQVAGLRDIITHRYPTLRMDEVWEYATKDSEMLKKEISSLLQLHSPSELILNQLNKNIFEIDQKLTLLEKIEAAQENKGLRSQKIIFEFLNNNQALEGMNLHQSLKYLQIHLNNNPLLFNRQIP